MEANGTIYEGKSIYILVQAILSKISSMALANNYIPQEKNTKAIFTKEIRSKEKFLTKTQCVLKSLGNDYI